MASEIGGPSIISFVIQHLGSIINLSVVRLVDTGDRTLDNVATVLLGGIITMMLTKFALNIQSPMFIAKFAHVVPFWKKAQPYNPFEFYDIEVPYPCGSVVSLQSTITTGKQSSQLLWWILNNSRMIASKTPKFPKPRYRINGNVLEYYSQRNTNIPAVQLTTPPPSPIQTTAAVNPFINTGIFKGSDSERWVKYTSDTMTLSSEDSSYAITWYPFYKATDGSFVYIMFSATGVITFGSETRIGFDEVMTRITTDRVLVSANEEVLKKDVLVPRIEIRRINPSGNRAIGYASRGRVFDSLFFEDKDKFVNILTAFKNGTLYPKHVGSDNKIGILLYGPPGTGKTHTVVATANFLDKTIASIQMRDVKTCGDFDLVMEHCKYKHIFVLEEIDCVLGVIRRRDATGQVAADVSDDDEYKKVFEMYANTDDKDQKTKLLEDMRILKVKMADRLTLSYILEKLDGITDESGRIIIATTNHPELIDPALLRPGRLGYHLHLGKCTHRMIVDILRHYYSLDDAKTKELDAMEFPDKAHSPAEVIQRIQMETSIESVIHYLKTTVRQLPLAIIHDK